MFSNIRKLGKPGLRVDTQPKPYKFKEIQKEQKLLVEKIKEFKPTKNQKKKNVRLTCF